MKLIRRCITMILVLAMVGSINVSVLAKEKDTVAEDKKEIIIDKGKYDVDCVGNIRLKGRAEVGEEKFLKSINFLVDLGLIKVNSDYSVINYLDQEIKEDREGVEFLCENYDAIYHELTTKGGKYYGLIDDKELYEINNKIERNFTGNNEIKESNNNDAVTIKMLDYPYYDIAKRNATILYGVYTSYYNAGHNHNNSITYAALYFVSKVKTGGAWDYKKTLGKTNKYYCDFKSYKAIKTGEDIGNMHYGTVGSVLFVKTTLCAAAGVYQIVSGTYQASWFSTYFDDPRDQDAIIEGIGRHTAWRFSKVYPRF